MGWADRLRTLLRREARDAKEALDDAVSAGNRALDRKERELAASPDEKLTMEQQRIADSDAEFEALRAQIEGKRPIEGKG